jgi:leucyl aminopeptidase
MMTRESAIQRQLAAKSQALTASNVSRLPLREHVNEQLQSLMKLRDVAATPTAAAAPTAAVPVAAVAASVPRSAVPQVPHPPITSE